MQVSLHLLSWVDYIKGIVSIFLDTNGMIYKPVVTIIGIDFVRFQTFPQRTVRRFLPLLSSLSLSLNHQHLPTISKLAKCLRRHLCGSKSYSHRVFTPEDNLQLSLLYLPSSPKAMSSSKERIPLVNATS